MKDKIKADKTKNRLLISLVIILLVLMSIVLFNNFTISSKYNHCEDNLFLVNEDLHALSKVLRSRNIKIQDFESLPDSLKGGFHKEENTIQFQLLQITFDDNGNIKELSH